MPQRQRWWREEAQAISAVPKPWKLSGCLAWWESDDSIEGTGGNIGFAVSCTDKVAGVVATNADATPYYPGRTTAILAGHAVFATSLQANPGNLYSTDAALLAAVKAATTWSLVGYARNNLSASSVLPNQAYIGTIERQSANQLRGMRIRDLSTVAGAIDAIDSGGSTALVNVPAAQDGAWHRWLIEWNRTTGASTYRVDNGASAAGPTRASLAGVETGVGIGAGGFATFGYSAVHGLYNRTLTASERALIDAYLVKRFV